MDQVRIGMTFRAVRVRAGLRQSDVGARCGVSAATVSRIEAGHLDSLTVETLDRVARALEIRLDLTPRWRGGDLDRLIAAGHAMMHELVAQQLTSLGWEVAPEVSFSSWGERGVIDILAWHPPSRTLVVIELKTQIVDVSELLGSVDRKRRLASEVAAQRGWRPYDVGVWLVVADTRVNRSRVTEHGSVFRAAFPARVVEMRRWLREPSGPIAGLTFLQNVRLRNLKAGRRRVRQHR